MSNMPKPLRGDIYWADLEPVTGSEQGKSRPVFVISNNLMNEKTKIAIIIPMTRDDDESPPPAPFYIPIKLSDLELDDTEIKRLKEMGHLFAPSDSIILGSHGRTVSQERLLGRIGKCINFNIISKVEDSIKDAYGLTACIKCGMPLRPNAMLCPLCNIIYHIKCKKCGHVSDINNKFCSVCGEVLR